MPKKSKIETEIEEDDEQLERILEKDLLKLVERIKNFRNITEMNKLLLKQALNLCADDVEYLKEAYYYEFMIDDFIANGQKIKVSDQMGNLIPGVIKEIKAESKKRRTKIQWMKYAFGISSVVVFILYFFWHTIGKNTDPSYATKNYSPSVIEKWQQIDPSLVIEKRKP